MLLSLILICQPSGSNLLIFGIINVSSEITYSLSRIHAGTSNIMRKEFSSQGSTMFLVKK